MLIIAQEKAKTYNNSKNNNIKKININSNLQVSAILKNAIHPA